MLHTPTARKDQLIVKELDDETLVYDLERDEAHCLNQLPRSSGNTAMAAPMLTGSRSVLITSYKKPSMRKLSGSG
jgi:hypothetical protein